MNTNGVSTYILDSNVLASKYIHSLLVDESFTNVKTIEISLLDRRRPIDRNRSLVVVDQLCISPALIPYGQKLKICFPDSRLVVIAEQAFGSRVERVFQSWVLAVVEYPEIAKLPRVVRRAVHFLSGENAVVHAPPPRIEPLLLQHRGVSRREMEIFELLCMRFSNKEIANQLKISVPTVKFHASNIYAKLKVRGRRELVVKAGFAADHTAESLPSGVTHPAVSSYAVGQSRKSLQLVSSPIVTHTA